MAHWAADGLLAIFFFVAGIELKRELVAGELRTPAAAALPVIAALCGMAVPAARLHRGQRRRRRLARRLGRSQATDIAFALAVLAVSAPRCRPPCAPSC